jgi:hypothetical protein
MRERDSAPPASLGATLHGSDWQTRSGSENTARGADTRKQHVNQAQHRAHGGVRRTLIVYHIFAAGVQ